ncbi:MAG: hypothetical protein AAGU75_00135 [Bacillota bacterium]
MHCIENTTDKDLAIRMIKYIDRTEKLLADIDSYLTKEIGYGMRIMEDYKQLKKEIKDDAHFSSLIRNGDCFQTHIGRMFQWAIQEASAWGFTIPTNGVINWKLHSTVYEGRYKLLKMASYKKLQEWAEGEIEVL